MINKKTLDHLLEMAKDERRLMEFLNNRNSDELGTLLNNIKDFISKEVLSPKEREDYTTILSYVEAKQNGLLQEKGEVDKVEFIDTSKFTPLSVKDLIDILGLTIKKDDENKVITFFCFLSAYTKDSQFNISFNAPSSSGKSYISTEIAEIFPQQDVIEVGYCSPTAFFHDKAEYNKERNELVVDLSHKILIFLDQPHTLLLQHLRPILSHDKEVIHLKITDKSQKAGLRTKNVQLKGFPAVIFCTAGLGVDEQESTRFILLSPEIHQDKIREGILEKIKKSSDPFAYKYELEINQKRQHLKERIIAIKQENIEDIIIKSPEVVREMFFKRVKILKPKHQRDMGRIMALIKVFALLNLWFRERKGSLVVANYEDIQEAFKLWDIIADAQELNLPPYVYQVYQKVILEAYQEKNYEEGGFNPQGVSRQEVLNKYREVYGRPLSNWVLSKEIIPMLEASGLVIQEADKEDRRKMLIYPTTHSTTSREQKTIV